MPGTKRLHPFSNTTLRVLANMGCTEITHSGLCDSIDAIFEHGKEGRSGLKLIHLWLMFIKYGTDMPVTKRLRNYKNNPIFVVSGQFNL